MKQPTYVRLDLLLALYIAAIVAAELMGSKTFPIGSLANASVAIFIFPLTFAINDIVTEVHGRARARSFVRVGLIVLLFLLGFNILAVLLPPSTRFADSNDAYTLIFQKSIRITIASLIAFYIAEQLDILIFHKIRQRLGKHHLWIRSNASNVASQLIDTIIFMTLAFYSPGNIGFIISLIIPYWLLKSFHSVISTPLTYAGVKWLKEDPLVLPANPDDATSLPAS